MLSVAEHILYIQMEVSGQPQATALLTAKTESLVSRLGVTQNRHICGGEEQ